MIDSHCHWDFPEFDHDRSGQLQSLALADVSHLLVLGVEPAQWPRLQTLQADYRDAPCQPLLAYGVHPCWGEPLQLTENAFKTALVQQLQTGAVAIGECGMDGSIEWPEAQQRQLFGWHLQLACDLNLPLLIHAHRAHNPVMQLLSHYRPSAGGVIHGFAGSPELAQQYWRLGFYLGVGGTITYPRAQKTRRALAAVPLQGLLLETDAPDMPLMGYQGQANTPARLPLVAQALADLRQQPLSEIMATTTDNCRRLLRLAE